MEPELLRLQQLLQKETWTAEEAEWLRAYLRDNDVPEGRDLLQRRFEEDLAGHAKIAPDISSRMRQRILASIAVPRPRRIILRMRAGMAAAVILLLISGWFVWEGRAKGKPAPLPTTSVAVSHPANVILPGSDKAQLKLPDGSVIALDSAQQKSFAAHGLDRVSQQNGKLTYGATGPRTAAVVTYNTLSTPKGGQYQLVLEDGTHVWLNAASSISFPTAFTGADRQVDITGEAYFEVAKDRERPFRVLVNHRLQTDVLGTSFNIMAYDEEPAIVTTLVEGSVRLVRDQASVILKPGEQARLKMSDARDSHQKDKPSQGSPFSVSEANMEQTLAWKNGKFEFDNTPIEAIMRQVARWYDVEISYRTDLRNQLYSGEVERKENISELLKVLEYTGTVHFEIEGRKIVVTQ